MIYLVIIAPVAHISKANNLAGCKGLSIDDLKTFNPICGHQDSDGDIYSLSCGIVSEEFKTHVISNPERPAFDTEDLIDLTEAGQAQALIDFTASDIKNKITAKYCDNLEEVHQFISDCRIKQIPEEE